MSELRVVPFKVEHIELIDIREHESEFLFGQPGIFDRLENLQKLCEAGTIIYKGIVLGVMGALQWWDGVYEVWLIPSIHVKEHNLVFAKHVKQYLDALESASKAHRIQITALDDPLHNRWIEFLGFKVEGTLKQYSKLKQDYKIWARINNGN